MVFTDSNMVFTALSFQQGILDRMDGLDQRTRGQRDKGTKEQRDKGTREQGLAVHTKIRKVRWRVAMGG